MYPTVNDLSDWLRRKGSQALKTLSVLILGLTLLLGAPLQTPALSDVQQLVVDSWKLVNQGYLDPDHLDAVRWRRQRQKALEKSIESSEDAYRAIEVMLSNLGDPYTRVLRPADYAALKNSTSGNLSGVGLQLGPGDAPNQVVVISALEGSPAAEAALSSGTELMTVDGVSVSELGLEGTAAALRGDVGTQVVLTLASRDGEPQ